MPDAAERIAELREHYARAGRPVDHLSDAQLLLRELDATAADRTRINTLYGRLLLEQTRQERDARAAERRSIWNAVHAEWRLMADEVCKDTLRPLAGLIYRIGKLPQKPSSADIAGLREAADAAGHHMRLRQDGRAADLNAAGQFIEEAKRLREVVLRYAPCLCDDHGADGPRCGCRGCNLIRALDDTEDLPTSPDQQGEAA